MTKKEHLGEVLDWQNLPTCVVVKRMLKHSVTGSGDARDLSLLEVVSFLNSNIERSSGNPFFRWLNPRNLTMNGDFPAISVLKVFQSN